MFLNFFFFPLHDIQGVFFLKYKFVSSYLHVPLKFFFAQGAKTRAWLLIFIALTNPIFISSSNLKADLNSEFSEKENSHIFPNDVYSILYVAFLYLIKTRRCYQLIMFPPLLRDISSVEIHSSLFCVSIIICL